MSSDILSSLNSVQKEAVETINGPLLVLAGAGTGKTKVLTTRVVNILNNNFAKSYEILAVTFTNKAAKEMRERIELMLGQPIDGFWIGTFHSIGLRILRRHVNEVGLKSNFSILDTSDCEKIIKELLVNYNIDTKKFTQSMVLNLISRLKDKNILADIVPPHEDSLLGRVPLSKIYEQYQARLKELNSVDFGDLLLLCVDLFRQFPDVLELWQNKFKYLLIDEFQDTNTLQYVFIRLLGMKHNNICCVGDDDQSIYSWRGAEISNILNFEKDFVGAKVLRLEQNYRSTTPILQVASSIISKNTGRLGKTLWTENDGNIPVRVHESFNSKAEAEFIVNTLINLCEHKKVIDYNQAVILVRASYQTREIEERLNAYKIHSKIIGGVAFFNRLEIKDIIAYIRLHYQKYDDMAFLRIINLPKRGIGDSSIKKIRDFAIENKLSLFEASEKIINSAILKGKAREELTKFVDLFYKAKDVDYKIEMGKLKLAEIARYLAEESGYIDMRKAEDTKEAEDRIKNIEELYNSINNYVSIEDFLEHVALVSEKEENEDISKTVYLSTLHASKGLEFDVVFLTGWEEGILPSPKSVDENGAEGLEEERRLAYVGITRAKKQLYISYSLNRQMYGSWQNNLPSRFLSDINPKYIEKTKDSSQSGSIMNNSFLKEKLYGSANNQYNNGGYNNNYKNNNYSKNNYNDDDNPYNPIYQNTAKTAIIKDGSRVKHSSLGLGTAVEVKGPIVEVHFDDGNKKKIMISFLKLADG